jgi:hypothetical protein
MPITTPTFGLTYDRAMGQNNIVSRKLFLHHLFALAPPEFLKIFVQILEFKRLLYIV